MPASVTTTRAPALARISALASIRIAGFVVASGAVAAAIAYAAAGAMLDSVWVPTAGSLGTGAFVDDYPVPLRILLHAAFAAWCVVIASMALMLASLAAQVRRGGRFSSSVTRATWGLALTLGLGGWFAQTLTSMSEQSGVAFPDHVDPHTADLSTMPIGWGFGVQVFIPNPMLLGLAVVLGMLAYIIGAGERLQRDTEGLV